MPLEVIPALDVAGGRLVYVTGSAEVAAAAYGSDPSAAAEAFVDAGAARLHVVDVDLARSGEIGNGDVLRAVSGLGVSVQASGGVRTAEQVDALLARGAERVVLGSAALVDRDRAEALVGRFGDRLVIGIEVDGPTVRPRGTDLELPLRDVLVWLARVEVRRYLFTEVGRVGGLEGPDLDGIWAFADSTPVPVVVAGGIRGVDDLRAVAALGGRIEGAVIGRALYEGLDLRTAIAAIAAIA
ncbi:MAG TPA: HisA/HisF-related TIM barrel protein [Actinomycetota bacterium]|nr:HisA/HisF-related TIM barrel protein [Actinomycetota bacterium]